MASHDLPGEIERDLVVERQRPDRHAGHARGILDHRRRHAFEQHQMAFADVIADAAVGVEAARIVDDDRRLLDRAHEVERGRERAVAGLLPMMISTSIIRSTGEKKWMPMKFAGRSKFSASDVIGSVDVLEAKIASGPITACGLLRRLGLDVAVLEHRLDDEIAALQRGVVGASA